MERLLTLTTDFGLDDWFVGTMKGVLLSRAPGVGIVDITHGIPPGDIRSGAFALAAACPYFPAGTIHVAVVDPGVGSDRAALAVKAGDAVFVGPDNGVFSFVLGHKNVEDARYVENNRLFLPSVSRTFHGRDVFAPVAAYLACGGNFDDLGPKAREWIKIDWPAPLPDGPGRWLGEVVYIDGYGNAITNLPITLLADHNIIRDAAVVLEDGTRIAFRSFYTVVETGAPVSVPGSTGFIEIAVNGGSAATQLSLKTRTPIGLRWEDKG